MSDILAMPDSGNHPHPRQHGQHPTLLVEDLHPREVQHCELAAELEAMRAEEARLPGFETLTWADLDRAAPPPCPAWCVHADMHDTDADPDPYASEHRGVRHSFPLSRGGASFGDHDPNATISLQLEQDHDRRLAPGIVLELAIDNVPHEAYLGAAEVDALQHIITQLLNNAER